MASQRLAIFDLDGTLTSCDTFARFLAGLLIRTPSRWLAIPQLARAYYRMKAGKTGNAETKKRFLTLLVAGLPPQKVETWASTIAEKASTRWIHPNVLKQVEWERKHGAILVLATASPDLYVENIAKKLGFHSTICTKTQRNKDGSLTGNLLGENCYGLQKLERVMEYIRTTYSDWYVAAYTDHHSDLPLLEWSDEPHIVNPTPALKKVAIERGYAVLTTKGNEPCAE